MNYLPKNRNRGLRFKKSLLLGGLFLALGALFAVFDSMIISAVSPLWRAQSAASGVGSDVLGFFRTKGSLIRENDELKEQLASLKLELSALSFAAAENERLLELLGRQARTGGITATVLTYPPQSPYDLIIVDAGERDGVVTGARVTLPEGPEVGVVEETGENFARVRLFSTPGEKTPAVLERDGIPVTLEGTGAGNFKVVAPREAEAMIGDRVLSANLDTALVAVIEEVNLETTDAFKELLARSPVNIFSVRFVTILP